VICECVWFLSIICINGFDGLLQPEACFSLQHGHHSNPAVPNLQHTTDTTQTQQYQISNTPRTLLKPSRTKSPTNHRHYSNQVVRNLQHNTDTTQTQPYQISYTPQTLLKHSRTKSPTHHRHYSNPAAPNLQHTTNREQNDRCGNSTTKSQAPDDGYINARNMLST
jgi:hypothetical protein